MNNLYYVKRLQTFYPVVLDLQKQKEVDFQISSLLSQAGVLLSQRPYFRFASLGAEGELRSPLNSTFPPVSLPALFTFHRPHFNRHQEPQRTFATPILRMSKHRYPKVGLECEVSFENPLPRSTN